MGVNVLTLNKYMIRFYTQGLHAILHEPDTAKLCYSFIALLSLDQLCLHV